MELIPIEAIRDKVRAQQGLTAIERFLWYHQPGGASHDVFRADLGKALEEAADNEGVLALARRLRPMAEGTAPIPSMITYAYDIMRIRDAMRELRELLSLEAVRNNS